MDHTIRQPFRRLGGSVASYLGEKWCYKTKSISQPRSHLTCFINERIRSGYLQHKVGDGLEGKKKKGKERVRKKGEKTNVQSKKAYRCCMSKRKECWVQVSMPVADIRITNSPNNYDKTALQHWCGSI